MAVSKTAINRICNCSFLAGPVAIESVTDQRLWVIVGDNSMTARREELRRPLLEVLLRPAVII